MRVFQVANDHGQSFKILAGVLVNRTSSSLVFGSLPFRIELDSISGKPDSVKPTFKTPHCGMLHCEEGEQCAFCDELCGDQECGYWCGEMCRPSGR